MKSKLLLILAFLGAHIASYGQCPPNIDFETGTYANWQYYTGTVDNVVPSTYVWHWSGASSTPTGTYHTLTTGGTDPWGGFPKVGAGTRSLQLNGQFTGRRAAKARYVVTVPSGSSVFSLIYRYAVVLEDPGHSLWEQPRFTATATNLSTGVVVPCADFTFVAGSYAGAAFRNVAGSDVWYLPWQMGSFNLTPGTYAIDFAVGDCSLGGHWAYAYIDMSCGTWTNAITACYPGSVTLPTAPPGFMTYKWYVAGSWGTVIHTGAGPFSIATPAGVTNYAVIMTPFAGFGCAETLYVKVTPVYKPTATLSVGTYTLCGTQTRCIPVTGTPGATVTYAGMGTGSYVIPMSGSGCITVTGPGVSVPTTYTLYLTGVTKSGCTGTVSGTATIKVSPSPVFSLSGPVTVCSGSPYTICSSVTGGCTSGCIWAWSWGATTSPCATHPPVFTTWGISTIQSLTITNSYGCSTTHYIPVNVSPTPNAGRISGPRRPACSGDIIPFSVLGSSGFGVWSISAGTTGSYITSSGVVHCGTVTIPTTVTIYYTVTAPPCAPSVASFVLTINPKPVIAPYYNPNPLCAGVPYTLHSNVISGCAGGCTYAWTGLGGFSSTFDPVPRPGAPLPGGVSIPYYITVTNSFGCSASGAVMVNVNPTPTAGRISGPRTPACSGDIIPFSVLGASGPGTWSISAGSTGSYITSAGVVHCGTVTIPTTVTIHYSVGTAPCGPAVASFVLTINPKPVIAPYYNPNPLCAGVPYTLYSNVISGCAGGCTYAWTGLGGFASSFDPVPRPAAPLPGGVSIPYYITVTNSFGCSASGSVMVNVNPTPTAGTISGPRTPACSGDVIPFTVFGASGLGTWSIVAGGTGSTISSTGVVTCGTVTIPTTVTIHYSVGTAPCGPAVASFVLTINPKPVIAPYYNPNPLCAGVPYTLYSNVISGCAGGCTYAWTGLGGFASSFDPVPRPAYPLPGGVSIPYYITVTNSFGCSASGSVMVNVNPAPNAGVITGPPIGCTEAVIPLTLTGATPGGTWTCTAGATISSTGVLTIGTTPGVITVTYTVGTLPCIASTTFTITIMAAPVATITGPTTVCMGSIISLSLGSGSTTGGAWSSGSSSIATVASTGPTTADVGGAGSGTTTISYSVTNKCGTATATHVVNVIKAAVACPETYVDIFGNLTFRISGTVGAVATYQFYDCSWVPIPGTYTTPPLPGSGFVIPYGSLPSGACGVCVISVSLGGCVWPAECCARLNVAVPRQASGSAAVPAAAPGGEGISVIPNPNRGSFVVKGDLGNITAGSVKIEVVDMLGKTVYSDDATLEHGNINKTINLGSNIANGIYLIRVKNDEVSQVVKFNLER